MDLHVVHEGTKLVLELDNELAVGGLEVLIGLTWHLEFHIGDLDNGFSHDGADDTPGNLLFTRGFCDGLLGAIVEHADDFHHTNGLG